MLFKSRADVALLQATDQAGRLAAEADETERRYHSAYLGGWIVGRLDDAAGWD